MAITIDTADNGVCVIKISGRLGLAHHLEFVQAYESIQGNAVTLDLSETLSLDSTGLGMLLAMREHLGGEKSSIEIINCTSRIVDILEIAHFSKLFCVRSIGS